MNVHKSCIRKVLGEYFYSVGLLDEKTNILRVGQFVINLSSYSAFSLFLERNLTPHEGQLVVAWLVGWFYSWLVVGELVGWVVERGLDGCLFVRVNGCCCFLDSCFDGWRVEFSTLQSSGKEWDASALCSMTAVCGNKCGWQTARSKLSLRWWSKRNKTSYKSIQKGFPLKTHFDHLEAVCLEQRRSVDVLSVGTEQACVRRWWQQEKVKPAVALKDIAEQP